MSFTFQGATISARELTIGDDDDIQRLISQLPPGAIINSGTPFLEFMVGAVIEGDSPLPMVTPTSKASEIADAYEAWKRLPRSFMRLWRQEVENVDTPAPKASASAS